MDNEILSYKLIDTLEFSNKLFLFKLNGYQDSICLSEKVSAIIQQHISKRPFHLNVIEAACRGNLKETGHSLILADMLRHPAIQKSFLERFLNIHHEEMAVTAETDRVDVALKGDDIFVIIENKVNCAEEQQSQVYRYVHDIGICKYKFNLSQIYVVYLNHSNRHLPSKFSLCDEKTGNNVFDEIGEDHYTVQSYKYDVADWLRKISIEGEPHISSALDQYIDYLENKFHTSPKDKIMNKEIKDLILNELRVKDKTFEEQIEALDSQREKVNELLNAIDNIKTKLQYEHSHNMMLEWKRQVLNKGIQVASDEHSFGIQLNNGVWLGIWDEVNNSAAHLPYWGFYLNSYRKSEMPDLFNTTCILLENAGITKHTDDEKDWIAWYSTQKGVERFMALYTAAKKHGLI